MTRTAFDNWAFLWGLWTFFETVWIAVCWQNRSRVLGDVLYRRSTARRIRRGVRERRVQKLIEELGNKGVAEGEGPDKENLIDRLQRMAIGRWASACWEVPPLLIVGIPMWWVPQLNGTTPTPLWMGAAVLGFFAVSIALVVADQRAITVSDPAGNVTDAAVRFLELLLLPERRPRQGSVLTLHHGSFSRLCRTLRAQARHRTRGMSPVIRTQARDTTERLIAALYDAEHRYLLAEGADREAAVSDLCRLAASALRHSCRPLAERDSLVAVAPQLLHGTPDLDPAGSAAEPLLGRLLAGAGRLTVAAGLFAGAYVLLGEGVLSGLLGTVGLVMFASVYRPLRDALPRVAQLSATETQQPSSPALTPTADTR